MAQLPTLLPQGHYLGVHEVNTMVPGIGRAPWKGDHSGSPEAVPADPCRWGSQEALQGPQPKERGNPFQEEGRGIQAPLKKIWFPKPNGHSSGRMTTPHPQSLSTEPFGAKGAGLGISTLRTGRLAQQGKPCLQARPRDGVGEERQSHVGCG